MEKTFGLAHRFGHPGLSVASGRCDFSRASDIGPVRLK